MLLHFERELQYNMKLELLLAKYLGVPKVTRCSGSCWRKFGNYVDSLSGICVRISVGPRFGMLPRTWKTLGVDGGASSFKVRLAGGTELLSENISRGFSIECSSKNVMKCWG